MKKITALLFSLLILLSACNRDEEFATPQDPINSSSKTAKNPRLYSIKKVDTKVGRAVAETSKLWEPGDIIKIKFLTDSDSYDASLESKVKQYAEEWRQYANVKFEYVAENENADVKIGFEWGEDYKGISYSTIGTDCKAVPQNEASLNFVALADDLEDEVFIKAEILRGFGHVLGLGFEHRNPSSSIEFKYKTANDKRRLEGVFGMDFADIMDEIIPLYETENTNYTEYDNLSIMVLPIPGTCLTNPKFGVNQNPELSETDKKFIAELYPYPAGCQGEWTDFEQQILSTNITNTSITNGKFIGSCIGADGKAYFASTNNGIWRLENNGTFIQVNSEINKYTYIVLGPDNKLYLGCSYKGVFRLNTNNTLTSIIPNSIHTSYSYVWKNGELYFGIQGEGIWKCNSTGAIEYYTSLGMNTFMTLGQDGLIYLGVRTDSPLFPLIRINNDKTTTEVIPADIASFKKGILGPDNKTYFIATNDIPSKGIWRLEDDGTVKQANVTTGNLRDMRYGQDGKLYFIGDEIYRLEDDGQIKSVSKTAQTSSFYWGGDNNLIGPDGKLYVINTGHGRILRLETNYKDYVFSKLEFPKKNNSYRGSQLGQDNTIYIYDDFYDIGVLKVTFEKGEQYATNFLFNNQKYSLANWASLGNLEYNDLNGYYLMTSKEELNRWGGIFLDELKPQLNCENLSASNSLIK